MTMRLITVKPSHVAGLRIIYSLVWLAYNSLEDREPLKGNTVGSRSSIEKAYIAGFLDGDGSIMLQIKKRSDTGRGLRFMATICFYQDTRHEKPLFWIREVLGIGYISRRSDSMSELRINGFAAVRKILQELQPHIRFKATQTAALIRACIILEKTKVNKLSNKQLLELVNLILIIQNENYVTRHKRTREELLYVLGLTP